MAASRLFAVAVYGTQIAVGALRTGECAILNTNGDVRLANQRSAKGNSVHAMIGYDAGHAFEGPYAAYYNNRHADLILNPHRSIKVVVLSKRNELAPACMHQKMHRYYTCLIRDQTEQALQKQPIRHKHHFFDVLLSAGCCAWAGGRVGHLCVLPVS